MIPLRYFVATTLILYSLDLLFVLLERETLPTVGQQLLNALYLLQLIWGTVVFALSFSNDKR